ncbi:phospholipase D family protein [Clostridium estertheticum]|uniref:Phospholipase D family protein n=1 Tax=Clostridium estertheticum TaxID=238834 RepID=A0AA47ENE5_9CLOT|nr:phospholipase D family protein [Clostridium estertheticum]MBU3157545.1 phospholipase D family protein [Clostridium estertheticum]MBU3200822.1 phospholipase D family protein [Clostridium estertheticum]WAG61803.1 phospholipase D family protein [Clostridium estertheticum]WAG64076.1 phospholipase D family protein [Clostridium estertheticum]
MYYWNKNTEKQTTLEQELYGLDSVKEIYIGTAFFSIDGLRMLKELSEKYKLKKDKIKLFLSAEFTYDKPHKLLTELLQICTVRIFFDRTFHSKVYLIRATNECKLIFGSSNFTSGGFKKNIEFDSIETLDNTELASIDTFFNFCGFRSTLVDGDVIEYYKNNFQIIEDLQNTQKKIRKRLKGYIHQEDALEEDDLEIEDFYFNFEDYKTFFVHNQTRNDVDIRESRKVVQDKILAIHRKIYSSVKKLGVECHWRQDNITSGIIPSVYNKGRVGWIGVRYGKTKAEVTTLNFNSFNAEDLTIGFQKHACLQFCIVPSGFHINLFLAVKHGAIDRAYMHEHMNKLQSKIEEEISKLKGLNMTWEIYDEELDETFQFNFNGENEMPFCKYFEKYDIDGRESYLVIFYKPDNPTIKNIDGICNEIIKYIKLLLPLYNSMVYRPKV